MKRKIFIGLISVSLVLAFSASALAFTVNYGLNHYNPMTGKPNGYAYTNTTTNVDKIGARAKVRNSDGTVTYSPWAYYSNEDYVRSGTVTANSYLSSGVVLYGYHHVEEAGYQTWDGTTKYSY